MIRRRRKALQPEPIAHSISTVPVARPRWAFWRPAEVRPVCTCGWVSPATWPVDPPAELRLAFLFSLRAEASDHMLRAHPSA